MVGPCGMEMFYTLTYINVIILVVILYYSFASCYHWEKLGKEYSKSMLFITTVCESIIITKH